MTDDINDALRFENALLIRELGKDSPGHTVEWARDYVAKREAENAALRAIAQAVAGWSQEDYPTTEYGNVVYCPYCHADDRHGLAIPHADDCPVTQARALLAHKDDAQG